MTPASEPHPASAPRPASASRSASAPRPGVDVPDGRGRTGLDAVGRDLTRNPRVRVRDVEVVSDGWHVLRRTTLEVQRRDGSWERQQRETYDRGNGAAVLPWDRARDTVLLTAQFRWPAYVNAHPDGVLVEVAAGLLDADDPETAVRREAFEELGVRLGTLELAFAPYMSPGSVTEQVFCYAADYTASDRETTGGGLPEEGEDIEVLELTLDEALAQIASGTIVDGKTILLLQWAQLRRAGLAA